MNGQGGLKVDVIDYNSPVSKNKYYIEDLDTQIIEEDWFGSIEDKPEMERELFEEQRRFFYSENDIEKRESWLRMFYLTKKYSTSLIKKRLKNKKFVEPDLIDEKSSVCAMNFMSQYIERPGFHVGASFAGMLNPKVCEVLYKETIDDTHESLNDIVQNDSESSLETLQDKLKMKNLFVRDTQEDITKQDLSIVVSELIDSLQNTKINSKQNILLLLWFFIMLRKPKNKHIKNCYRKNWCNFAQTKIIDLFELEFYNKLREIAA